MAATEESVNTAFEDYSKSFAPDEALSEVDSPARELFEKYSHIAPSEVLPHILRLRRQAFAIHPYPCIGQFRFLQFSISLHPAYERILALLKSTPSTSDTNEKVANYLDIGCCVGQDLRKLAFDGAPAERLVGIELEQPFIDLGYDLFRDKETFKSALLAADIFDEKFSSLFEAMKGRFDVVHAASFFHLFSWERQVEAAVKIVTMMKEQEGVMIVGRQVGNEKPGVYGRKADGARYLHDLDTFKEMWDEVGEKTGSRWNVNATSGETFGEFAGTEWKSRHAGTKTITFEVTRMA